MQPEPPEVFQHASPPSITEENPDSSTHHGLQDYRLSASLGPFRDARDDGSRPFESEWTAIHRATVATRSGRDSPSTGMSDAGSLGGHVSSYEKAVALSASESWEGPSFQVVSGGSGTVHGSLTDSLPNEILIHAFSHLSPSDLNACALVCRRFHTLLNSPYVWKAAFIRYFPGNRSGDRADRDSGVDGVAPVFTRLSNRSTWRSEYILRTQLLRAVARGKPMSVQANAKGRAPQSPAQSSRQYQNPLVTYDSDLLFNIDRIDGAFGAGPESARCKFMHGQSNTGMHTRSDPSSRKPDGWGNRWAMSATFSQLHPGEAEYGLGSGTMVGCPNVMDISQHYGVIHGVGTPKGFTEFHSTHDRDTRRLSRETPIHRVLDEGVPQVDDLGANCAVWIAKSRNIPLLSNGLVGMLVGSATGIVSMFSLGGPDSSREARLQRGDLTARWVLSPGVPIIGFRVDEEYSLRRLNQNRVWAIALNALGEIFYLTKFPTCPGAASLRDTDPVRREALAWKIGRTVYWSLAEPSRRSARPDPYRDSTVDGSYSPRSSWIGMCLDGHQLEAETREIESFLRLKPIDFRNRCVGWEMRRKLEVDFSGDDGHMAGESVVVFTNPEADGLPDVTRYGRVRTSIVPVYTKKTPDAPVASAPETPKVERPSIFGSGTVSASPSVPSSRDEPVLTDVLFSNAISNQCTDEWRVSKFTFGLLRNVAITVTALDVSNPALAMASEGISVSRDASSGPPSSSGSSVSEQTALDNGVNAPGKNSRFVAAGTSNGTVFLWNIRAPGAASVEVINKIEPVGVIRTDSPSITSLALNALCVVHGGEDGLVQIWDPLGSKQNAIRTLNSRFTARYHRLRSRRLPFPIPSQFSQTNGATALLLDPNPTVLRGIVALGTDLRFWSFSSEILNEQKRSKRRLRRAERGSNGSGDPFVPTLRGSSFKKYVDQERRELEREQEERRKRHELLSGRFGVGLLDNEEDALAYATMLSEQSLQEDMRRRESESSAYASDSSVPVSQAAGASSPPGALKDDEEFSAEIEAALRLSREMDETYSDEVGQSSSSRPQTYDIPIRYAKPKRSTPPGSRSPRARRADAATLANLDADLEFAKQLSLAEEASRKEEAHREGEEEDFPVLGSAGVKGKLKA